MDQTDKEGSFESSQGDSVFLDDTQTVEEIEIKQLPEVKDEWRIAECLELMKLVNLLGKDFSQISTRIKSMDGMTGRPRNYFSPEICEAMFNKLLAKTKKFPGFEDFFGQIYTEKAHVLWLINYYQNKVDLVRKLLKDALSDRKYVNFVKSYFSNTMDDETKQKVVNLMRKLYNLLVSTLPYDELKEVDRSTTACSKIFTNNMQRNQVNSVETLREQAMLKYMENLYKSELEIVPALNVPIKTSKSKISPPKVVPQKSPLRKVQIISPPRKILNIPAPEIETEEPPKKKRVEQITSVIADSTPKMIRDKKSVNAEVKPMVKVAPKSIKPLQRSTSKNSRQVQIIKSNRKDVEVQTLLCLLNEAPLEKAKRVIIYRPRKKEETKENAKRTVGTQTTTPFTMTKESIKWEDRDIPCSDLTSKIYGACLRSDSKFIRNKTLNLNFYFNETGLKTYHAVTMRSHPCKMAFEQLKNLDSLHYFYNPVRFEALKYRRMIHRPMDLLTIEDLMVRKQINTNLDLFLHVALICSNGVVFDIVAEESTDYFFQAAKCLKPFFKKEMK